MATFAPLLTPYSPTAAGPHQRPCSRPRRSIRWAPISSASTCGRSCSTAARTDLRIAFLAVILPFILGTTLGCLAGYYGTWVDVGVMRSVDIVVAFPVLRAGHRPRLRPRARRTQHLHRHHDRGLGLLRAHHSGEILVAKQQDYVLAARSAGFGTPRIIVRHLLPNVITQAIVFATADVVLDILAIVTLGYLGLGVPPPTPDWGRMIFYGQQFLTTQWQLATFPGLAVVVTGIGLAMLGDGFSDLLRPE